METPKALPNGTRTLAHGQGAWWEGAAEGFARVLSRRRRLVLFSFLGVFAAVALFSLYGGDRYQARMMILVSRSERADAPVNGQANAQPAGAQAPVTVEEINSEVDLLRSQGLLRQVVADCGLDAKPTSWWRSFPFLHERLTPQERTAQAVRLLADKLQVEVLPMSDMIQVTYHSSNPALAARVLQTLSALYLKKHVAVHRPPGVYAFFAQQAQRYQTALAGDESKLVDYTQKAGVVSAPEQISEAIQRMSQFQAMRDESRTDTVGTRRQVAALEQQLDKIAPRLTTAIKTSDNAQLLQNLKSALLSLELQRTKLLENYQPTYRPVRQVEKQIAETKGAIAQAEKQPWREVTTDRDPTFELALGDLTKARAQLADDEARTAALGRVVGDLQRHATWLQRQGVVQQNLMRNFKTAEANYLLYQNKAEEARIDDALDSRRILNVSLAEAPAAPSLPNHSAAWLVGVSGLASGLAAIGLAFVADNLDPTIRAPEEVEMLLDLRLLAVLPPGKNGNGHNGHRLPGNGKRKGWMRPHVS